MAFVTFVPSELIRQKDKAEASKTVSKADKTSDVEEGGEVVLLRLTRVSSMRAREEGVLVLRCIHEVGGRRGEERRAQGYSYVHSSREIAWRLQRRERVRGRRRRRIVLTRPPAFKVLDRLPPEQG